MDPARLSDAARARRDAYAAEQADRREAAAGTGKRPAARLDRRGRLVVNAADALSRMTPRPTRRGAVPEEPVSTRSAAPAPRKLPAARKRTLLAPPCRPPAPPDELAETFAGARLRIEMIPEPLWERSLKKELPDARWRRLRVDVVNAAGHRCEICGGQGRRHAVECHEEWAYDDEQCVQRLVKLVALCPDCHMAKTPGRAGWLASLHPDTYGDLPYDVQEHLARVNGWDLTTAVAYVRWSTQVNRERGQYAWTQDLGAYGLYGTADRVGTAETVCGGCFTVVPSKTIGADGRGPCCA